MRQVTGGAILHAFFINSEDSAAFIPHEIQRTVAKQAVKIIIPRPRVTGEELAFIVAK
jgi:hypothetical protein